MNSQGHAWGSPQAIKDFTTEHGGPRDHAAEQRSFNSAARENAWGQSPKDAKIARKQIRDAKRMR